MGSSLNEIGRNEFDEWCWRRGLELRDVVDGLREVAAHIEARTGRALRAPSIETVRLILKPFSDGARRIPGPEVLELIHEFTDAAILPAHFYPPHLRGAPQPLTAEALP